MARTTTHAGKTFKAGQDMKIVYDAELADLGICDTIDLLFLCCSKYDKERSYLYLREGSIESNRAFVPCQGACEGSFQGACDSVDNVSVQYFDRPPFAERCCYFPFPVFPASHCCCVLGPTKPKLEIVKLGCMCCCTYMDPFGCGSKVVLMPFETYCGCCSNRVGCWDNCCGLQGRADGNPKCFQPFAPQPVNKEEFVSVAAEVMFGGVGGSPEVIVRE